jgi:hypothetical protein
MPSHIDASILMKKSERLMLEKKKQFPDPRFGGSSCELAMVQQFLGNPYQQNSTSTTSKS